MLNRRVLRVKAMQSLYGYFLIKESLRNATHDMLLKKYQLDPAIHDFSDRDMIEAQQKQIGEAFLQCLEHDESPSPEALTQEVVDEIESAVSDYRKELQKEETRIKKYILKEANGIYFTYIKILLLVQEFVTLEKHQRDKRSSSPPLKDWHFNLVENSLVKTLLKTSELKKEAGNSEMLWLANDHDKIKRWYKDIVCKHEDYVSYQKLTDPSIEAELEVLKLIFKRIIFKSSSIEDDFVEMDLHWSENKSIVKNLVLKTIKSYDGSAFHLMALSHNKDEDFEFFQRLVDETLKRNVELEDVIRQKARNWDLNRIANIDMVILKMALTEMICFTSIPVKVTINEFIDISKLYSTPKSKQFVNGILDVMANDLTSEGVIKKSGRGLIDNK